MVNYKIYIDWSTVKTGKRQVPGMYKTVIKMLLVIWLIKEFELCKYSPGKLHVKRLIVTIYRNSSSTLACQTRHHCIILTTYRYRSCRLIGGISHITLMLYISYRSCRLIGSISHITVKLYISYITFWVNLQDLLFSLLVRLNVSDP